MSFWMTRYRKLSGSKLSRGTRIRFMRWVLITSCLISRNTEESDLPNRIRPADFSYAEIPSAACAVYHSYVEATPHSSGIWADHPKA